MEIGLVQSVEQFKNNFFDDKWVWDADNKSPDVQLSRNCNEAYFHLDLVMGSVGTAGVRGNKAFIDGEHYWEIIALEPMYGSSVMIGVGTEQTLLHTDNYKFIDLIGMDDQSWGLSYKGEIWHKGQCRKYCEPFYEANTVIGCHLNLYNRTLTFYKNGINLGVAFTELNSIHKPIFPIISSTASETEMEVGLRVCRYLTLQEKCCLAIKDKVLNTHGIDRLPLPNAIKRHIKEL